MMMEPTILPLDIPRIEGPDELYQFLCHLLDSLKENNTADHYVLYQWGQQQSLIKIDLNEQPFQFWYCDLYGRPATNAVKESIAQFLWEKGGEKERYLSKERRG